jgi:hypothetical protein
MSEVSERFNRIINSNDLRIRFDFNSKYIFYVPSALQCECIAVLRHNMYTPFMQTVHDLMLAGF